VYLDHSLQVSVGENNFGGGGALSDPASGDGWEVSEEMIFRAGGGGGEGKEEKRRHEGKGRRKGG